jgi:DNA-binding SARP family transcriptional activator
MVALRLYRAGQQRMLRELGLQPGSRLQSLYRAILADPRPASQGANVGTLQRAERLEAAEAPDTAAGVLSVA